MGEALWRTGASHPSRHRSHLTIVTFHRVLPEDLGHRYPFPGLWVSPAALRFCLQHFQQHYDCLPLSEAYARWSRSARLERPVLAVTFDDGTRDHHDHAHPVLHEAGVRATFFVPVEAVTRGEALWHDHAAFAAQASGHGDPVARVDHLKRLDPMSRTRRLAELEPPARAVPFWAAMMTWDQVRALSDAGHEIGSHTMSHGLLPQYPRDRKYHELVESKRLLEQHLGSAIPSVAYPNGDADVETLEVAAEAGYTLGVTTRWGTNHRGTPPLTLRRCDMDDRRFRRARDRALHAPRLAWRIHGPHPTLGRNR